VRYQIKKGSGDMKIRIFGKNIKVTEGIKADIEKKLGKLDKYLAEDAPVDVTLSVDKDDQKVEVTIPVKGNIIRAEEVSDDMYATIDMVEETIERQIVKYKKKIIDKKKAARESFQSEFFDAEFAYDDEEDDEVKIVKTKRFGIKPMFAEEACVEMDLIGHNFFVFLNAETNEVNVVYKRKNGAYGLIEPELD
jgi:putative sigma-54 modulation protein